MDDPAELRKKLATAEAERDRAVFEPAVERALVAVGVPPHFLKAAVAMFVTSGKMERADGVIYYKDAPLPAAITDWAATAEGLAFLAAARGGPAVRPSGKRSEMTPAQKGAYLREHGLAAYEALPK